VKFKDLQQQQMFILVSQDESRFVIKKVQYHRGSCCKPEHNAIYHTTDNQVMAFKVDDDLEVEVTEEDFNLNETELVHEGIPKPRRLRLIEKVKPSKVVPAKKNVAKTPEIRPAKNRRDLAIEAKLKKHKELVERRRKKREGEDKDD